MGIPGLTSFVEKNFKHWHTTEVKGKLVVDGSSLLFILYNLDWSHGGQYAEFRSNIQSFFQALRMSGISPIVVMDGVDVEGRKRPEVVRRRKERVGNIDRLSRVERIEFLNGHGVLPPLVSMVYAAVLKEMEVDLTFADGEGDVAVYQLANGYGCPVLSNDSDFFMFNLRNGYIPLSHFRWKDSMPIMADVFYHTEFCSQYQLGDPRLRFLVPAIAGNDFVQGIKDGNFLDLMSSFSPRLNRRYESIGIILNFIGQFSSLKNFKEKIRVMFDIKRKVRESLVENFTQTQELYESDQVLCLEEMKESTSLCLHGSSKMPKWLLNQFRSGDLFAMHIVVTGKHVLNVSIDDTSRTSSALASKPIRKFMYGLIGWEKCLEMDRVGYGMEDIEVEASTTMAEGIEIPRFARVPTISASEKSHMLYSILGCSDVEAQLERLHKNWRLAIAATRFWYMQCSPTRQCVEALLLGFVFLSSTSVDTLRAMHLRSPEHFRKSPAWMELLHSYSQWQNCYGDAYRLNQLFKLPLKTVSAALLFDGRLVMYVAGHNKRVVTDRLDSKAQALYRDLNEVVIQQQQSRPPSGKGMRQQCQDAAAVATKFQGSLTATPAPYSCGKGSPCKPKGPSRVGSSSQPSPTLSPRQPLGARGIGHGRGPRKVANGRRQTELEQQKTVTKTVVVKIQDTSEVAAPQLAGRRGRGGPCKPKASSSSRSNSGALSHCPPTSHRESGARGRGRCSRDQHHRSVTQTSSLHQSPRETVAAAQQNSVSSLHPHRVATGDKVLSASSSGVQLLSSEKKGRCSSAIQKCPGNRNRQPTIANGARQSHSKGSTTTTVVVKIEN